MSRIDPAREAPLRARIAAGSEDPNDYLTLADILTSVDQNEEAIRVYEGALRLRLALSSAPGS
jgi:hypothetical protein